MVSECLFCQIVSGAAPAHVIWEDSEHLAFLSIYPNTVGASVVIPRTHYPSYVAALPQEVAAGLHRAAAKVAHRLDQTFGDVARTAIVYEGYGIDHVHAKLFPLHGTAGNSGEQWRPIRSAITTFLDRYEGYVSTHDSHRADDAELRKLAEAIRASAGQPSSTSKS